ncbi:hypothetical protein PN498_16610 [Oscillatoria sp. CS-180]|uniref:hypothetical protein n=1 Tax=Oscillatoria sp. CS-180 TaxID=3021720 RepID=UPI00232DAB2D|nr:hypothetical protein [Oscillatoria sp. CS-180]MDB9527620.1 hypothetical protein [Oscillatoria sp. CS-180]
MKTGLVIYAIALQPMVDFYTQVFGFNTHTSDDSDAVLYSDELELVLLQAPVEIANSVTLTNPPQPRESTPIKPVFFIDESTSKIRDKIHLAGGHFNPKTKEWTFQGRTVCDGWDLEGNIFQVRSSNK